MKSTTAARPIEPRANANPTDGRRDSNRRRRAGVPGRVHEHSDGADGGAREGADGRARERAKTRNRDEGGLTNDDGARW